MQVFESRESLEILPRERNRMMSTQKQVQNKKYLEKNEPWHRVTCYRDPGLLNQSDRIPLCHSSPGITTSQGYRYVVTSHVTQTSVKHSYLESQSTCRCLAMSRDKKMGSRNLPLESIPGWHWPCWSTLENQGFGQQEAPVEKGAYGTCTDNHSSLWC